LVIFNQDILKFQVPVYDVSRTMKIFDSFCDFHHQRFYVSVTLFLIWQHFIEFRYDVS
jgi:hypothetical protein